MLISTAYCEGKAANASISCSGSSEGIFEIRIADQYTSLKSHLLERREWNAGTATSPSWQRLSPPRKGMSCMILTSNAYREIYYIKVVSTSISCSDGSKASLKLFLQRASHVSSSSSHTTSFKMCSICHVLDAVCGGMHTGCTAFGRLERLA